MEGIVKSNWQHQKDAVVTDQKSHTDDEHIHEADKRHLKSNSDDSDTLSKPRKKAQAPRE